MKLLFNQDLNPHSFFPRPNTKLQVLHLHLTVVSVGSAGLPVLGVPLVLLAIRLILRRIAMGWIGLWVQRCLIRKRRKTMRRAKPLLLREKWRTNKNKFLLLLRIVFLPTPTQASLQSSWPVLHTLLQRS